MRPANHILPFLFFFLLYCTWSCQSEERVDETESSSSDPEQLYMEDYDIPERKWGFLDRTGDVQITPQFDLVSGFTEGLAAVSYRGKWGFIDKNGEIIIRYKYRSTWPFHNGYARVTKFDGTQCLIDRQGRETCVTNASEVYNMHNGRARVDFPSGQGYIDRSGEIVIPAQFDQADNFALGYAVVSYRGSEGLIDTNGKFVIEADYDDLIWPSCPYIPVSQDGDWNYIDINGNRISTHSYSGATAFQKGRAAVRTAEGWVLVDSSEQHLTGTAYSSLRFGNNSRWIAGDGGKFAVIAPSGRELSSFIYDQINNFSEGLAAFYQERLCGYIDTTGTERIPAQYGLAWDFQNGLARAAFRDGIAYIRPDGTVPFIPCCFEIRDFSEGLAPFQED